MQRVLEGWTHVPPLEGTESGEISLHEPSLLIEEEVLENLGHEWRVVHLFDLPRVRFPMDTTPPNQRRLAENDGLVELIQTIEYLEDIPMWGQRDYQLYPPRYGDPFYRGRGRGRGRGKGRREMMIERPPERDPTQGFERGLTQRSIGRGNGREFYSQGPLEINERYRQIEEWLNPASKGRRRSDAPISSPTAHNQQPRIPPTPAPSEDRCFTDWSSIGSESPNVLQPPQSVPVGDVLMTPRIEGIHKTDQTALQTSQPTSQESYMGAPSGTIQENFPTTPNVL